VSRRLPTQPHHRRVTLGAVAGFLLAGCVLSTALGFRDDEASTGGATTTTTELATGHLVLSEIVTGGASASDELVELYNPGAAALPTEGLELIYVSASGATITRKASWAAGSAQIPAGAHLLIANAAGVYAPIADLTYATGLAATGGSLALRVLGASSAVDAVGWGTAVGSWLEGSPVAAPAAGHSIERLPGGAAGSTQDTDQNAIDFVERAVPDPQNSTSPPVPTSTPPPSPSDEPSGSPTPTHTPTPTVEPTVQPTPSPTATPSPSPSPTPSPTPVVLTVAAARALPDGSLATIEGITLTDGAFTDGGGYLADATAGIAVLVSDNTFPSGVLLRASGTIDDRYHQRTLRTTAADVMVLGPASDPAAISAATGEIGEGLEGQLAAISGIIASAAAQLSGGVAFDVDDGSGPTRVVVGTLTGIETAAWERGATVTLRGVVGQRDSSGTGSAGYRLQPRGPADVVALIPPPTSTPTPSPSPTPTDTPTPTATSSSSPSASPSPSPSPAPGLVSIATARQADSGTRLRIRGVVTLPSGLTDPGTAAVQDASGAILVRLGDDAGNLARGELVELAGTRSSKAGMLTLRVTVPAIRLGHQAEPSPTRLATGRLGEEHEAQLVVIRGAMAATVHRTSAGNTYFDVDDGSGPARIFVSPRASVPTDSLAEGTWVEVVGVLGQDTTSQQPTRGYRVWPRAAADVTVLAQPVAGSGSIEGSGGSDWTSGTDGERGISGGFGTRAAAAGKGSVPHLSTPVLIRAAPTASPAPALAGGAPGTSSKGNVPNGPAAAGLMVAALLLVGTAGLATRSGLLERVRSSWPQSPVEEEADDDPTSGLVALTVLNGGPPDSAAPRAAPRNGGRILPPT
jgi:outer membrane biosynthesis protein TonB